MRRGFSLLELLVVIGVFAMLAVVSTQIVAQSLRGTRKSEASIEVRENVDYLFAVMERSLRSAKSVDCDNSTNKKIVFTDENGVSSNFTCRNSDNSILLNGNKISADDIKIDCTTPPPIFVCDQTTGTSPSSVEINISASEVQEAGREGANITSSTKIILRSF